MHEPLKNCPFCGGAATAKPIDYVPGWYHVTVLHSGCFYKPAVDQMVLNDESLEAWNRRTPQPVVREPLTPPQYNIALGCATDIPPSRYEVVTRAIERAHGIWQKGGKR